MKSFHVHVSVDDLERPVRCYSRLFLPQNRPCGSLTMRKGCSIIRASTWRYPRTESRSASTTWACSSMRTRSCVPWTAQLHSADAQLVQERDQACCHARSGKYWVTDPTGSPAKPSTHSAASPCMAMTRPSLITLSRPVPARNSSRVLTEKAGSEPPPSRCVR